MLRNLTNNDSDCKIDNLTDTEIYAAIRYLDVDRRQLDHQNVDDRGINNGVISVCLSVAMLLADLWFYWK